MNILSRLYDGIQDNRWIVLALSLIILVIYVPVLVRALLGTAGGGKARSPGQSGAAAPKSPPAPQRYKPSPPPAGKQEVLPSSLAGTQTPRPPAGLSTQPKSNIPPAAISPQVSLPESAPSNAKTLKLPALPSKSTHGDATKNEALSERAKSPAVSPGPTIPLRAPPEAEPSEQAYESSSSTLGETPSRAVHRKASRMEELGLHPGSHDGNARLDQGAPGPRNETAELTSILERIDKFLADDPVSPAASAPGTTAPRPGTEHQPSSQSPGAHVTGPLDPTSPAAPTSDSADDPNRLTSPTLAIVQIKNDPSTKTDAPSKSDPPKKTPPLWARADVLDEDAAHPGQGSDGAGGSPGKDKPSAEKPNDPGQQRLF